MNEAKINKTLFKLNRWSSYGLIVIMLLYFISGYGMTKNIIDPIFAKTLHEKWLPIPTTIFILCHILFRFRSFLRKRIDDSNWVNIYLLVFSLVILIIAFYLYLL